MKKRGLSLVELLVALAIGSILVILVYDLFEQGNKLYDAGSSDVMLQDIQRVITMEMTDDIRTSSDCSCTLPIKFNYLALPSNVYIYKSLIYVKPYSGEDFVYVLNKGNKSLYKIYKDSTILVIPGNIMDMEVIESSSKVFYISGALKCNNKSSSFKTAATIMKK
jgi:prepilin-type N-terminal cleavage/methylation domain-containing protein